MNHYRMQAPVLSKMNKYIIITYAALFILNSVLGLIAQINLAAILGLSLQGINSGLFFQLISFPFIETSLMSVVFHCLLVWFIGSELEMRWGQSFYLKFLGISVLTSGFVYLGVSTLASQVLASIPIMGLGGVVFALLMSYGIIFSDRQLSFMLIFPMKAKYFCMLLAGIELYMGIFSPYGKAAWAHLAAAAAGFAYLKLKSKQARSGTASLTRSSRIKRNKKSHLKIIDSENERNQKSKDPRFWQ